jgi:tol-pal system protein YbgF
MKKLAAVALVLCAACASTDDGVAPAPQPLPAAAEPRVAELQTTLTELLERIDVLNDRIARLEEGAVVAASVAPAAATPSPQPMSAPAPTTTEPRQIGTSVPQRAVVGARIAAEYRNALALFGKNSYAEARRAFEEVYEADPSGDLADNAIFWIGETYFAARDWTNAMRFYKRVIAEYPDQNKAPDALFKIALALEKTGDLALARKTFQEVIEKYPYSTPATSAKAELQRIRY